jgi:hypothetical protein
MQCAPWSEKGLVDHLALLLEGAFAGCDGFLLALDARFFKVFALANLGEDARFFALLLELLQRELKRLVILDLYSWHRISPPSL